MQYIAIYSAVCAPAKGDGGGGGGGGPPGFPMYVTHTLGDETVACKSGRSTEVARAFPSTAPTLQACLAWLGELLALIAAGLLQASVGACDFDVRQHVIAMYSGRMIGCSAITFQGCCLLERAYGAAISAVHQLQTSPPCGGSLRDG